MNMDLLQKMWIKARGLVEKYPVVIAGVVIYLYYLLTSVNFFKHSHAGESWFDYFMQFDSLIFLWLAAAAMIQVQRFRKAHKKEQEQRHKMERVLDRQQIYSQLATDITMLLQDNVNNPLAIIGVTTQEIRRRFQQDTEILRWLDRIDGAMQRIHNTIRDLQAYETQKMIDASALEMQEAVNQ
jgi:signal transduction histidine kinase